MLKVKQLIRIIERDGWVQSRTSGSHRIFIHRHKKGIIIIPYHGNRNLPKGLVIEILKMAGIWEKY